MWFACTSVYGYVQVYYMYACVHMCCMYMFVWTNVHMCCIARQKMSPSVATHFTLEIGSQCTGAHPLSWLASECLEICLSLPLQGRARVMMDVSAGFYVDAEQPNSGHHPCSASTLPTVPSFLPLKISIFQK